MMITKNIKLFHEYRGGISADASDLGLRPGAWPTIIQVVDDNGDGWQYRQTTPIRNDDEIAAYNYQTSGGMRLTVFND